MIVLLFIVFMYLIFQFLHIKILVIFKTKVIVWKYLGKMHRMIIFTPLFKGYYSWELQIYMIVFQVPHGKNPYKNRLHIGNLYWWIDKNWLK